MKILLIILTFFLQPVLWIGLIRSYLDSRNRIKRTRAQFNVAIYEKHYELRHFWGSMILLGILLSVIAGLAEVTLPLSWILIYEVLAILSLILVPSIVMPILIVAVPSLIMMIMKLKASMVGNQNYLFITGLVILALGLFIGLNGGRYNVPRIFRNSRDNRVAGYPFKELSIIPTLIMVPGNAIQHLMGFYPTFVLNGHRVTLMLLPLVLGLRLTVFKHQTRHVFRKLSTCLSTLGILGILLAIVSYRWPIIITGSVVALVLLGWLIYSSVRKSDLKHGQWYSEVINGVRVVGIEPNTPAAKMNLHVGDVILDANYHSVTNEDEFYEALEKHPTYCRLRVSNRNHRIILTSTAIYSGSPHEIGVVLFRSSNV